MKRIDRYKHNRSIAQRAAMQSWFIVDVNSHNLITSTVVASDASERDISLALVAAIERSNYTADMIGSPRKLNADCWLIPNPGDGWVAIKHGVSSVTLPRAIALAIEVQWADARHTKRGMPRLAYVGTKARDYLYVAHMRCGMRDVLKAPRWRGNGRLRFVRRAVRWSVSETVNW